MANPLNKGLLAVLCLFFTCFFTQMGFSQTQVSGQVMSAEDNSPLTFANLRIQGLSTGGTTDFDGLYTILFERPGSYVLEVSAVGFKKHTVKIIVAENEQASLDILLEEELLNLETVIVSATRTQRSYEDVPAAVTVISAEQIKRMNSLRLDEVLLEQTGLQVVSDHGTGLQMQGLSSEYILILIDGEPVIGRTAGTLDLSRLAVGNVKQIEVVRGPASSLYGSEAIAGVVNIITDSAKAGLNASVQSQYRSFNTLNLQGQAGVRLDKFGFNFFADHLSSDGYDLTPESISKTAPKFDAQTIQGKFSYQIKPWARFQMTARSYQENQENFESIVEAEETQNLQILTQQKDINLMPSLSLRFGERHQAELRHYYTSFFNESASKYQSKDGLFDSSFFDQSFSRNELQYDFMPNSSNVVTVGAGQFSEQVEATRYDDENRFFSQYVFGQYQFLPANLPELTLGLRYDNHSQYASQWSPKVSIRHKFSDNLIVQFGLGAGFKAPDFRQLLLNFTNATAGYSVVGSSILKESILQMQQQGLISQVLRNLEDLEQIQAESSFSYNLGFNLNPHPKIKTQVNLYHNSIENLIDTAPVAIKTNGQSVFSYFNIARVITQGAELQTNWKLNEKWDFGIGYAYLNTRDVDVWESIKAGEVFKRDISSGRVMQVKTSDYGGLSYRSAHSGNLKIGYQFSNPSLNTFLRAIYRGRFGVADLNGSGIIDDPREFSKGYVLLNLAAQKLFGKLWQLDAGINNILGSTNTYEPSLAGRVFFVGAKINFSKTL
jgi:outer membrane receptor for ferrienterochelin and colicins